MTITKDNVKLMASQDMSDYVDAGGMMSGTEIVDGAVNNMFADISRLDRVYGRVSLRKAFAFVDTPDRDTYYGSHVILTDPAADPRVNVTMFSTGSMTDLRSDARNNIESYVVQAAAYHGYLMGDQLQGARALVVLQREELALPKIGDVLYVNQAGVGSQYCRITDLQNEVRTYTVFSGSSTVDIKRRWIEISVSSPLLYTFNGAQPNQTDTPGNAKLYETQVADSAKYYSVKTLAAPITKGALTLKVDSIYSALVPSAQAETPFVDVQAGAGSAPVIPSGNGTAITKTITATIADGLHIYAGMGIERGSVSVTASTGTWTDDKGGNLVRSGAVEGSVNYVTGEIIFIAPAVTAASMTLSFLPAASPSVIAWSKAFDVSVSTRGYNWTATLDPAPVQGGVYVDYMALGNWYRLTDDGHGNLTGDGAGTVDYATGSVVATTAALPDVGTQVIFSWGESLEYVNRSGDTTIKMPVITATLSQPAVLPGSLTITWPSGGVTKTVTDDSHGNLTGDGTGKVVYATGQISLTPNYIHDPGAAYHAAYTQDVNYSQGITGASFTLPNVPIRPHSVRIDAVCGTQAVSIHDDGNGVLVADGWVRQTFFSDIWDQGWIWMASGPVGSIDYTTGAVAITTMTATQVTHTLNLQMFWMFTETTAPVTLNITVGSVHYCKNVIVSTPASQDIPGPNPVLDLTPSTVEAIVPGSVRFGWLGYNYIDRSGKIYRSIDPLTNAGTLAGTISYQDGLVTLTDWGTTGASNAITISSLLTATVSQQIMGCVFRLPGAPIRAGSVYIQANLVSDGSLISATGDLTGVITGTHISGSINYNTGVMQVVFDAPVFASSMKYNCVVYSYIPLDADLLGLDPVRLPTDGRVPVFRDGDIIVIHHTLTDTMPSPLTAGQVVTLSRSDLSLIVLYDANGLFVPTTKYTVNLTAGTVTMANPLDLTGFVQPLVAMHRREDMCLVSDVQISGDMSVVAAIQHDYPATTAYVSGALVFGDLQSRVHNIFDQSTWTNVWSDALIGSNAVATFDTVHYPIVTTNAGAISERWAIIFTSSTGFNVVGQVVGIVATGSTLQDCAPINPATGAPYFTIPAGGWGSGWATGNCLRVNTVSATAPLWAARTTLQGPPTTTSDHFTVQIRGDAN